MGFLFVPFLLALLYEPTLATLLQRPFTESVGPAFVWGSIPVLLTEPHQHSSRVIYEDFDSQQLVDGLWKTLVQQQDEPASTNPTALLVYVGNKLRLEDLSASRAASAAQPLQDSIKSASSSVSIPNLSHQGSEAFGLSLVKHFQGKAARTQIAGTCSATPQENEDAAEVVHRLSNDKTAGPKVLVVCGGASSTLEDELKTVAHFSKALQAVFGSHVTAYVSDMSLQDDIDSTTPMSCSTLCDNIQGSTTGAASREMLQTLEELSADSFLELPSNPAGNQAGYLCDDKCFTQVRVIEVFILFVTLLTALMSGICMMNVLGVPSKFETMKDARQES